MEKGDSVTGVLYAKKLSVWSTTPRRALDKVVISCVTLWSSWRSSHIHDHEQWEDNRLHQAGDESCVLPSANIMLLAVIFKCRRAIDWSN